jgi:DNA helicase-2/ATP-dependent DNA helicase PcrA
LVDLLAGLNEAQREAVLHDTGPAMIIAGAGSGKTRVLTHRLAYLIQQGKADAFNLLALTFTNKAAREMRARIERLIGGEGRNIAMGTFHSIFSRILRIEAETLGYTNNFTVYDDDDSTSLVRNIVKELKLDDKQYKPRNILHRISHAKNYLVAPNEYLDRYATDDWADVTAKVYAIYQTRLFNSNAMDFDDLLFNMVRLFEKSTQALYKYQHRFRYIMVDEYQDTNHAQYVITKKLAAVTENLTVVGDDAQSIYSFRGADIQNILSFKRDYPDVKIYKLEQNYRSTGTIVAVGNEIIANNKNQIPKLVYTENETGESIRVLIGNTEQEEAQRVVDAIREQKMLAGLYNKDFALLYRTNAQSRALEDGLRRAGIVYKIYGGLSFYKRKEVKDVVAYLRMATNPKDEEALKRIINYPARGIGEVTIDRIVVAANDNRLTMWDVLQNIQQYGLGRNAAALEQFAVQIRSFGVVAAKETAYEAVAHIAKQSGILKELHQDNSTEGLSRWENVQELINAAREYTDNPAVEDKSLKGFLAEIALFTDQDEKVANPDFVTLMTIHAAKGLEFKSVFVVGLEEGLFPGMMALQSRADLEEERRLFYVACTRAEKFLTFSLARSRFKYGSLTYNEPSRFLSEIDGRYIKYPAGPKPSTPPLPLPQTDFFSPISKPGQNKLADRRAPATPNTTPSTARTGAAEFAGDDLRDLAVGMRVEHNKFGIGTVQMIDGRAGEQRAIIHFQLKGPTTILLKYARLRILK